MSLRIKKCSNFLIEQEFERINKNIKLIKENINKNFLSNIDRRKFRQEIILPEKEISTKQEIINNAVESIEKANKIDEAIPIVQEIIPKKSDTLEVGAEKMNTTLSIFDHLTKNAKKFFIVTCVGLLGWNLASNLFSQKVEAKKILDQVKKAGMSSENIPKYNTPSIINWKDLGAGGSIGEVPNEEGQKIEPDPNFSKELLKKLEEKTNQFKKKYDVKDPSTMNIGEYFNASKTVFTSCNFPFPVNYNSTSAKYLNNENSVDIIGKYLKELDEFAKNKKTGLKLLALSMTVMEGYKKNTKKGPTESYTTNNPGNIDNTDSGHKNYYKTLKEGIAEQLAYLESAAKGNKLYPIGQIKSEIPYNSKQLGQYTPGFVFIYEGTLEQFVKVYATGPRLDNNYMNLILTFFRTYLPEANVTPKTKIIDIINSGGSGRLIDLLEKYNPGIKKAIAIQMVKGHKKSISDVIAYTGLTAEELKELNLMPETSKTKKKKK